ncbi:MAG: OmpA family protein, partial [Bacteroidia bacterium]
AYEKVKQKGFKNASVVGYRGDSLIANQEKSLKGTIVDENKIQPDGELPTQPYRKDILFDFDKAVIVKTYYKYLDSLALVLQKNKNFELIIIAASDSVGTNSYNERLAKSRAGAIQKYFIDRGITEDRLDINIFGENMPTEYDRKKINVISNRRVEILLVKTL